MAFSTFCSNKGCFKNNEPYLDPDTNKVHCSLCDAEIPNITHFTKVQMKATKQYKQKTSKPFAVHCNKCNSDERPKIINDQVICGRCSKIIDNISPIFKNMLKEALKKTDKDV